MRFKLALYLAIPLAVGFIGSLFMNLDWYQTLVKPSFSPPDWLFGPVWTFLYVSMGYAAYLIKSKFALRIYWIQLGLNGIWTPLFFGLKSPILGLIDISLLLILISWASWLFYRENRKSGFLMLPYLAWVSFATVLNLSIYLLN